VPAWLYRQDWLVRVEGGVTSLEIPRPRWGPIDFQNELSYYWLVLAVLIVVAAGVHRLRRTGVGRAMMAVRDNQPAAASLSISPRRAKLTAFVLSGMIASLAGYFYGGLLVSFPDANAFSAELSLILVAMVILGGVTSVTGAILGALWVRGLGDLISPVLPRLLGARAGLVLSGLGLLVAVLQFPGGIASLLFKARDRLAERLAGGSVEPAPAAAVREPPRLPERVETSPAPALEAVGIIARFGGLVAVDGVDLRVAPGEIVGLVGPNGAGKTTLFDVVSGHLVPVAGRVRLDGVDVTALRPEDRARLGLARSFQQARLFDDLSVVEAFAVALEREEPSEVVPSLLGLPPSRAAERRKRVRAAELADLLGLGAVAHLPVSELSTGMRRIAELGCTVALGARALLLDEPTAGIAQREVEAFTPALHEIRDHLGATTLVIDHDIPMVSGLCDRVYVLVGGRVIAEGPPAILRTDPRVIAAYIGTDERAISRSGAAAVLIGGGRT
jgi:ABC-type branched-subunit amino acid transport system ATPase component